MNYAPQPAGDGAYVALLEVAADQLSDERPAGDEVAGEMAAGDAEVHKKAA
jgi:hypothetical protein